MAPKLRVLLLAFAIALPLDLLTKFLVDHYIGYADRIAVIEGFFYLTHVRNPGAAFGLLMFVTIWYSAWGTRKQIPHLPGPPADSKAAAK